MNIGDKLPEVLGLDQNGKEVRTSEYAGRKVVLYFYPKDQTPGCTAEPAPCATITANSPKWVMK